MSDSWIRVDVPVPLLETATWRVAFSDAQGKPGEMLAASAGSCSLVVEVDLTLPGTRATARLEMRVPIEPDRLTAVRIPVPEPVVRAFVEGEAAHVRCSVCTIGDLAEEDAATVRCRRQWGTLPIAWRTRCW